MAYSEEGQSQIENDLTKVNRPFLVRANGQSTLKGQLKEMKSLVYSQKRAHRQD
jgi:hypothetical protein